MSKSTSRIILSIALLLSTSLPLVGATPALAAEETAEQFMTRFLNTVATTKTPLDIKPFLKPRKDEREMPDPTSEEDKKMMEKMMGAFLEMQKASTPLKAEIVETQDRNGQTLLILKATEVNPLSKLDLKDPKSVATGKMLLEKNGDSWLIVNEFWHYVYPNGLTTDSGHDPDAAPKVASPIDKYSDDIMSEIGKVWPDPAKGTGAVTIEFKNTASGQFEFVGVSDKHGSKEAEQSVKDALSKIAMPPLPAEVSDQPIVNIQLIWSPKTKDTVKVVQLLHSSMLSK